MSRESVPIEPSKKEPAVEIGAGWAEVQLLPPPAMTHVEHARKQARLLVELLSEGPQRWQIALGWAKALEKVLGKVALSPPSPSAVRAPKTR